MSEEDFPNLLIVIGASAGGLEPIKKIIDALPEEFQATMMIATHRAPGNGNMLKDILARHSNVHITEPIEGEKLQCTTVYVGKPTNIVEVDGSDGKVTLDRDRIRRLHLIDDLFFSAAEHAGKNAIGIILSGTMWDGVRGLKSISENGGRCIAQEPKDALFRDMPELAAEEVELDYVGTADEIAQVIIRWADGEVCNDL